MKTHINKKNRINREDFFEYIKSYYYNVSENKLTLHCECKGAIEFEDNVKQSYRFPDLKEEIIQIYEESIIPFVANRTMWRDYISIEEDNSTTSYNIDHNVNNGIQVIGNDCLVFASYGNCGEKLISMLNALDPLTDEDRDSLITEVIEKANKIKK